MAVGKRIRYYRELSGLSQAALAEHVGCAQPQISGLENEELESRELLGRVAEFFNAPDILTMAVRNSPLMRRAMEMKGIEPGDGEIARLLTLIEADAKSIRSMMHSNGHTDLASCQEYAESLAELAHILQIIIPLTDS